MPETLEDILYSPLWFNTHIVQGQNLYIKEWHDKGIRNVIDLLDLDGQFYQFIELKEKYNIHSTFSRLSFNFEKAACWLENQDKSK